MAEQILLQRIGAKLEPVSLGVEAVDTPAREGANSAIAIAQAAYAQAQEAQTQADVCLPRSGGTLTGPLTLQQAGPADTPTTTDMVNIVFAGTDNKQSARLAGGNQPDKHIMSIMACDNTSSVKAHVSANWDADGTAYASATHPRDNNYGNDIVTTMYFANHGYPLISGGVYAGDLPEASDTADLWQGRGLSAEKPFKTFQAAWNWLNRHTNNNFVTLNLLTDLEWDSAYPWFQTQTLNTITIQSYPTTERKKLILPRGAKVFSSFVEMRNLEINFPASGSHVGLWAQGGYRGSSPTLSVHDCVLSGEASTIFSALGNGTISVSNLSGTVAGKKYSATTGSRIFGVDTIPGTTEGTCDSTSVAA